MSSYLSLLIGVLVTSSVVAKEKGDCPFCNKQVLDYQMFYEDEFVQVLYNYKPMVEGHCLIIPKRHVERYEDLNPKEIEHLGLVTQKVHQAAKVVFAVEPYLLLQKNGEEAGQTVPHLHIHYIPRKEGNASLLKFLAQMVLANFRGPISQEEMHFCVGRMRVQMQYDSPVVQVINL